MCGRINLYPTPGELAEFFVLFREPDWSPRYNLGPMQQILAIRRQPEGRVASSMNWGLIPSWAKDKKIASQCFNARAETVSTKPVFRTAFKKRRCLIPASGFYEWQKLSRTKQPWNIFRDDGHLMAMAGLWEHWKDPDGQEIESCTVITTEANGFMAELHDRMPVILDKSVWDLWLDPDSLDAEGALQLLVPCPNEWLNKYKVSSLVGNVRNESPDCVKPLEETGTLF